MADQTEAVLLAKIAALDIRMKESCDLIPLQHWGLDESIKEKLRQRKHRIVAQHLSKKEKKSMSNARKQRIARQLGAVPNTVSEVLKWMSGSSSVNNIKPTQQSTKTQLPNMQINEKMKSTQIKKHVKSVETSDSSSEDDDNAQEIEHDADELDAITTRVTPKSKPLPSKPLKVEPKKRKESGENVQNGDIAEPEKKKTKLDEELAELEKVDTKNLDPEEARKLAMLKLKKRIESFKTTRRGKKSAEDYENQRKMKRRMSKLQLKQKKNDEKRKGNEIKEEAAQSAAVKKEKKIEALQAENAAPEGITYSKFDFIVKEDKTPLSKKDKRDKFTGKNYKRLLEKAEHRQEKIEKIREKNPEKAERIEENIKWNKVMNLAEGNKVKDNVELLKKAAKRKEKTKERSKNKWDTRLQEVEEKKGKKQDKREMNLKKRIDDAKKKKMDKLKKKGRIM